jgi:hypothetical protein
MSSTVTTPKTSSRVFDTFLECVQSIGTLARVQKIDSELLDPKDRRDETLSLIKTVWLRTLEQIQNNLSLDAVKKYLKDNLRCYFGFYQDSLASAETPSDIETIARRALSDINSVPVDPVIKSFRGQKGPTLLISFSDSNCSPPHSQAYVLKWTGFNELWANRIYKALSFCPSRDANLPKHGHGFTVPDMGWIDFDSLEYVKKDGQPVRMDSEPASHLKEQLQRIAEKKCKANPFNRKGKNQVMFTERIFAGTLFDFAYMQYMNLPKSEKNKLLSRLARLSLLDIIIGNLDRLIPIIKSESGNYQFDNYEANIGNVLVAVATNSCKLFAIDNEINPELVESEEDKNQYLNFLRNLFSSNNFPRQLSQTLSDSIDMAVTSYMDDDKKARDNKNNFSCFLNDLKDNSPLIEQQFYQMSLHLQKTLSERQNYSDIFSPDLVQHYPTLADAVSTRLQCFKTMRLPLCQYN